MDAYYTLIIYLYLIKNHFNLLIVLISSLWILFYKNIYRKLYLIKILEETINNSSALFMRIYFKKTK